MLFNDIMCFKAASRNTMHITCSVINFWDIFEQDQTAVKWKEKTSFLLFRTITASLGK